MLLSLLVALLPLLLLLLLLVVVVVVVSRHQSHHGDSAARRSCMRPATPGAATLARHRTSVPDPRLARRSSSSGTMTWCRLTGTPASIRLRCPSCSCSISRFTTIYFAISICSGASVHRRTTRGHRGSIARVLSANRPAVGRLESTYAIRQDLEDAVRRMRPRLLPDGRATFEGWARMALPVEHFAVHNVAPPKLGETRPASVSANLTLNLMPCREDTRADWQQLRRHDVLFLVACRALLPQGAHHDVRRPFLTQIAVDAVRGCEVEGLLDERGDVMDDGANAADEAAHDGVGQRYRTLRPTWRVWLDANQHAIDNATAAGAANRLYASFNVVVRRSAKENNFKAVLETIRQLLAARSVVPDWLHDVFLGYGDPSSVLPEHVALPPVLEVDLSDTFLDAQHLQDSFPDHVRAHRRSMCAPPTPARALMRARLGTAARAPQIVQWDGDAVPSRGPFVVRWPARSDAADGGGGAPARRVLRARAYVLPSRGPYARDRPRTVRSVRPAPPTRRRWWPAGRGSGRGSGCGRLMLSWAAVSLLSGDFAVSPLPTPPPPSPN